ncbi:MAG: hypothetical protein QOF73_4408 [Thermomicrobiales bacterium]|nr:hypothetical protein [Thermomicrobiales bacterium]
MVNQRRDGRLVHPDGGWYATVRTRAIGDIGKDYAEPGPRVIRGRVLATLCVVVRDRVQAKTTRDLWSADRPRPSARLSRRTAARRLNRVQQTATTAPTGEVGTTSARRGARHVGARAVPVANRFGLYALAAVVLVLALFFTGRLSLRGEIYPGVRALGAPLGGLSETEAHERLEARASELGQTRVSLAYDGHSWSPTLAELGVSFDVDASVRDAMEYGRDNHVVSSLLRPLRVADGSVDLPLAVSLDQTAFERRLLDLAHEIGVAPVDAAITFDGGTPVLTPERDGHVFDAAVAEDLLRQVRASTTPAVTLTAKPQTPTVRAADLATVQATIEQGLSKPLIFTDGDRRWSLAVKDLALLVRVTPPRAGQTATAVLDDASVRTLGERLAGEIDQQATEAGIDESGEVARLIAAASRRTVRVDDFVAAVQEAFADGRHEVVIPVDQTKPASTTEAFLAGLGVTELLASGTSDFVGSESGRVTNVVVAAKLVDGVMVPPNGKFSFNHAIGEINATPGFVPAGASENGIAGTAVGGGVCQVTTTVFRAVLKAGLPITEWWPHAYRNIYYEHGGWAPGFDASVQQPDDDPFNGSDFVFQNPTAGWLLVRAEITDDTKLKVDVYGAPTGYSVEIDDPIYDQVISADGWPTQESVDPSLPAGSVDLVQPARDGMTITVVRRVYDANGNNVSFDTFVSSYEPQGASYRVSSDMAGTTTSEQ